MTRESIEGSCNSCTVSRYLDRVLMLDYNLVPRVLSLVGENPGNEVGWTSVDSFDGSSVAIASE